MLPGVAQFSRSNEDHHKISYSLIEAPLLSCNTSLFLQIPYTGKPSISHIYSTSSVPTSFNNNRNTRTNSSTRTNSTTDPPTHTLFHLVSQSYGQYKTVSTTILDHTDNILVPPLSSSLIRWPYIGFFRAQRIMFLKRFLAL